MKVILLQDVKGVGRKHQTIDVKSGYATNMLFPKNYAIAATDANAAKIKQIVAGKAAANDQALTKTKELFEKVGELQLALSAKANETGKLFKSISAADIAAAVTEQSGLHVDPKAIDLIESIKETGEHKVSFKANGMRADVTITVTGE